ncbi:MAG TPA: Ig-like domain-containing protein [Bacteroidota bacterium]|nr:Ig-like domain-containing protein [Bacteroidota bacterium]
MLLFIASLVSLSCKTELDFGSPPRPDYDPLRDANIKPKVVETFPHANTQGPFEDFSTALQIRFNKIMKLPTLRQAIHCSSSLGDVLVDTTTIETSDGTTFIVDVKRADSPARFWWKVGQAYSLHVDPSAIDINGNTLAEEFSMSFMPEPGFRLLGIDPVNGDTDVSPDAASGFIRLAFNSELDASILRAIHIWPPIYGAWYVEDETRVYCRLDQNLDLHTAYSITVDSTARDRYGHVISGNVYSVFATQSFRVFATFPRDGDRAITPTSAIAVVCNAPIDTSSVRSAFSLAPRTGGYFVFEKTQFYFVPDTGLRTSTFNTVRLEVSLRGRDSTPLASPYTFMFVTEKFKIVHTFPPDWAESVPRTVRLNVQCNARILQSSVPSAFTVFRLYGSQVAGSFEYCNGTDCSDFAFYFTPSEPLAANTVYIAAVGYHTPELISQTGALLPPVSNGPPAGPRWVFTTGTK